MRIIKPIFAALFAAGLCCVAAAKAQSTNAAATTAPPANSGQSLSNSPADPGAEGKFKALLKNATLAGRWCMIKDGKMGPDQEDKYTIQSAAKMSGDSWVIYAHIQYGQRDIVAPIPVQVKWAGDTPVLIVDKLAIPGGGTYSARVLFYDQTYSGTWSGGDHGGLLHGVITNGKDQP